jgi:hypothetical protein
LYCYFPSQKANLQASVCKLFLFIFTSFVFFFPFLTNVFVADGAVEPAGADVPQDVPTAAVHPPPSVSGIDDFLR